MENEIQEIAALSEPESLDRSLADDTIEALEITPPSNVKAQKTVPKSSLFTIHSTLVFGIVITRLLNVIMYWL